MKNIVVTDDSTFKDFKPSAQLREYLSLTQQAIADSLMKSLQVTVCPACCSSRSTDAFTKFNLIYVQCQDCGSVYINPRPTDIDIINFYKYSPARKFWYEHLYKDTAPKRNTKIIKPRLQWIEDSVREYAPTATRYVDINASQPGYVKAYSALSVFKQKTMLSPLIPLTASDELPDVEIVSTPWWDVKREWDAVSLFEVLDHTSDVECLMNHINAILPSQGLCFLTVILSSGFDVQVLWEHAEHIHPPDRLNMFTIEGLKILFARHHFEILELSTPGILDVEIVAKAMQQDANIPVDRFIKYLLARGSDEQRAFQEFLQTNLLSSYARILLRKI